RLLAGSPLRPGGGRWGTDHGPVPSRRGGGAVPAASPPRSPTTPPAPGGRGRAGGGAPGRDHLPGSTPGVVRPPRGRDLPGQRATDRGGQGSDGAGPSVLRSGDLGCGSGPPRGPGAPAPGSLPLSVPLPGPDRPASTDRTTGVDEVAHGDTQLSVRDHQPFSDALHPDPVGVPHPDRGPHPLAVCDPVRGTLTGSGPEACGRLVDSSPMTDTELADELIGTLIDGRYRVLDRLARGGMATVYTARDERLERTVALKMVHPSQAGDPTFVERFVAEARAVAKFSHPNVVAAYDQGTHQGLPYLVMEYVRGRTLREILRSRRRLTPAEALAIAEQMAAGIAAAHHAGLVHRDIKPENVLISQSPSGGSADLVDSVVKVTDFGLAEA